VGDFQVLLLDDISEEELPAWRDQLFAQLIEANTAEEPAILG